MKTENVIVLLVHVVTNESMSMGGTNGLVGSVISFVVTHEGLKL